jgi:hypothetical protein
MLLPASDRHVAASLNVAPGRGAGAPGPPARAAAGSTLDRGPAPVADYPVTWNPVFFMSATVAFCTLARAAANEVWFCSAEANASE